MKQRILAILLSLTMMFTLVPTAMAEGETAVAAVAKVGNVEYATLAEAVEAAKDGETVTLLKDAELTETLNINKAITLDGANHIITGDSSAKESLIKVQTDGDFTLTNCIFAPNTPVNINNNKVEAGVRTAVYLKIGGTATVTNNTFEGVDNGYYNAIEFGIGDDPSLKNATISGNTFTKTIKNNYFNFYNMQEEAVINITNNQFLLANKSSNGIRISNNKNVSATFNLDSNTYTYAATSEDSEYEGLILLQDYAGQNAVQDFKKIVINITNLTAPEDAKQILYVYDDQEGIIQTNQPVVKGDSSIEKFFVAKVGDTYYKTLAEAVAAADNATVTLLKDVTANVTIPADKTITLDLNGKTLNGGKNNGNAALLNKGTVTIKDSSASKGGTIKREDNADLTGTTYYVIKNLGTMTIEQANVNNNSGYKETNSAGSMKGSSLICNGDRADDNETTLTINDGVFEQQNFLAVKNGTMGILNVNGGKFTSKHSAIQNWYKADIKGGEINGQLWTDAYTWAPNGVSAGETKISGTTKFTGEIVMDITGSVKPTLEISGGEMNVTNWRITSAAANAGAKPVITGGTFSSDPSAYVPDTHHVEDSGNGSYPFAVKEGAKSDATIIVTATTNAAVSDTIESGDKAKIEAVKDKANVEGMAAAIRDDKKAAIAKAADVTDEQLAGKNMIETEITVKVEAKAADLANGKLTFEASPVATVKVNGAAKGTTVPVTNDMLNGQPITVKLPLPEGFTPKQIKHISSNGSVEYFLKTAKRGAKLFTVDSDNCAVFTITKFSTFELSGTITYVEPSYYSGSSSDPTYSVTVDKTENGSVTVSPKSASKGDTVTVTVKPDSGYVLETLTVTDKNGNELTLKDKGDGKYTFTMPAGKVEVKATFMEDNSMLNFFYDVPNGAYFYEAVKWAVENGITTGVGNDLFAPEQPCTRAQIVTFLWRAAGSPEPKTAVSFADVPAGSYYAKAVAWAIENGITNGMTATEFAPNATCTRGQSVTFLHRALKGTASGSVNFTDVPANAFYADAVNWAVASDVTNGTSNTTFSPNADCTRAEIVTFLYRAYQGK